MKTLLFKALVLAFLLSCSENKYEQSGGLELDQIAKFALSKQLNIVIDSLHFDVDKLSFMHEPPGIIKSVSIDVTSKGTIEFFFERTSVIEEKISTNEQYLGKAAKKVIEGVEWESINGKKGSIRNIKIY